MPHPAIAPPTGTKARLPAALLAITLACASAACAPRSPHGRSISDPIDAADGIAAIGRAGDLAYAVTRSGKLRVFNLKTHELRTLDRTGVIAIARDASVALSASGTVIEAWEPGSGRPIASHRFDHELARLPRASRATALIVVKLPPVSDAPRAIPPPSTELLSWDLASGAVGRVDILGDECDDLGLSADGAIVLCDLHWKDLRSGTGTAPPPLAPEWAPPDSEREECNHCIPQMRETGMSVLSVWPSADAKSVYVTYERTRGGQEWRLDRWIPDATGKTEGCLEHLVVSHEPTGEVVVAVSSDGRTLLTDDMGVRPPVLRHAPGYEGVSLPAPPVTAAAFSEDDRLIVTGHGDGRLRLWEARVGRFLAVRPE